ncbi:CHZ domain-containing protein [Mycena chlorophos]|uniref:CHZ domain-containing protein n=1 Tax=Mycena chlorophos TaxID=658473 RepID=A0A8H6SVE9_MYCCL|nr:CHZ domain-containing protein [Mycena chlorophos]
MSTSATDPTSTSTTSKPTSDASPADKGKGKVVDQSMEEDDEEEEEEEDDDEDGEEEESSEEEEESLQEIDPSAIQPRRTRGVKVDYTSAEALAKAGLTADDEDEDDEDVQMKDD